MENAYRTEMKRSFWSTIQANRQTLQTILNKHNYKTLTNLLMLWGIPKISNIQKILFLVKSVTKNSENSTRYWDRMLQKFPVGSYNIKHLAQILTCTANYYIPLRQFNRTWPRDLLNWSLRTGERIWFLRKKLLQIPNFKKWWK